MEKEFSYILPVFKNMPIINYLLNNYKLLKIIYKCDFYSEPLYDRPHRGGGHVFIQRCIGIMCSNNTNISDYKRNKLCEFIALNYDNTIHGGYSYNKHILKVKYFINGISKIIYDRNMNEEELNFVCTFVCSGENPTPLNLWVYRLKLITLRNEVIEDILYS